MNIINKIKKTLTKKNNIKDIYIILILITIIFSLIFIIFPEITYSNYIYSHTKLMKEKEKFDNFFIKKYSKTQNYISNETQINDEYNKIKDNETIKNNNNITNTNEQKYLLKRKDEKTYIKNESFILNFTNLKYEKDKNQDIILNENNVLSLACNLKDFSFNEEDYKLSLSFNFKNISNEIITFNKNGFYLRYKGIDIIKCNETDDINIDSQQELDNQILSFSLDKNISKDDLNLFYIDVCYTDDLNIRNIELK